MQERLSSARSLDPEKDTDRLQQIAEWFDPEGSFWTQWGDALPEPFAKDVEFNVGALQSLCLDTSRTKMKSVSAWVLPESQSSDVQTRSAGACSLGQHD